MHTMQMQSYHVSNYQLFYSYIVVCCLDVVEQNGGMTQLLPPLRRYVQVLRLRYHASVVSSCFLPLCR